MLIHVALTFRIAKNLYPNLQKPLLPLKIPGYAPGFPVNFPKFLRAPCFYRTSPVAASDHTTESKQCL